MTAPATAPTTAPTAAPTGPVMPPASAPAVAPPATPPTAPPSTAPVPVFVSGSRWVEEVMASLRSLMAKSLRVGWAGAAGMPRCPGGLERFHRNAAPAALAGATSQMREGAGLQEPATALAQPRLAPCPPARAGQAARERAGVPG